MEIEVCAGVVEQQGKIMLATRPEGKHLAGKWEFPGGKVQNGESLEECIRRELMEELSISVAPKNELVCLKYEYPEKTIRLHFMYCAVAPESVPVPMEGQRVGWFSRENLPLCDMAPADAEFIQNYLFGQVF